MDFNNILFPMLSLGGMGIIFGLGLGYAGLKFKVDEDPRIALIRNVLPGANCGGCGLSGCAAFASAVVAGDAAANACPVGGASCTLQISEILGIEAVVLEPYVAYIKCAGDCETAAWRYDYQGVDDCAAVMQLTAGGSKNCAYGCLGAGSCVRSCDFDAIQIVNGIAVVEPDKCLACGKCISVCPRKMIELKPKKSTITIACNSKDNGKTVRSNCKVGCIACKQCQKACQHDAITITNMLAEIDYDKCTRCGDCVKKCPMKTIKE